MDNIIDAGRLTVYRAFAAQVRQAPGRLAIEHAGGQVTYGELGNRVRRLAAALQGMGIGRGDRIALLSENRVEFIE